MATQQKLHFNGKKWLKCTDTTGRCPYGADAHKLAGTPDLTTVEDLNAALDNFEKTLSPAAILKNDLIAATAEYNTIQEAYDAEDSEVPYSDMWEARHRMNELKYAYNQTPEGLAELRKTIAETTDEEERSNLEFDLRQAENAIRAAEAKKAFDAQFGGSLAPAVKDAYTIPAPKRSGDELWPETTGSKYDPQLRVRDIATNIKKDIAEAQKAGFLPTHVSFKTTFNSGDGHVNVTIIGADDRQVLRPEVDEVYNTRLYTEDAIELRNRVEKIMKAYNFTRFDSLEHHTNLTNFWAKVEYESSWEKEERLAKEAKKK